MATATATELESITAAKVIDARGAACPGPLLEAKKGMGGVPVGSVIEISVDRPGHQDGRRRLVRQGRPHIPGRARGRRLRPGLRAAPEVVVNPQPAGRFRASPAGRGSTSDLHDRHHHARTTARDARGRAPDPGLLDQHQSLDPGIDLAGSTPSALHPGGDGHRAAMHQRHPAELDAPRDRGWLRRRVRGLGRCHECAFLPDCAERSSRIMAQAQALLKDHGLLPQRVRMAAICSVCADPFTKHVQQFARALADLAPSKAT